MTTNKDCIISVELGTNAVRMLAFDIEGNTIDSVKGSYPTFHSQPDYSEQDPEQIFITMLYVLKNLLTDRVNPAGYKVVCICFSASMHSLLTVDKHGAPLGRAITWADNRGKVEARELNASPLAKKFYDLTGTPIHPMSPLVKIKWMNNHDKETFASTSKFISIKTYIIQQLTGEYLIDYSLGSATGLMNIQNMGWEQDALDYVGITSDRLPTLAPVFSSPGQLKKEYQKLLGVSNSVKLLLGSSDGCLATIGSGVWSNDKAVVTIEDSGAVRVISNEIMRDEKRRLFNYVLTEDCYVFGGPTNNGGVIFEWFAKQFGDFSRPFDIESSMDGLFNEVEKSAAGSDGLLFLPYLLGERAPLWNPNARGVYFGVNIKHERQHFIRATIEGILYEVYSISKLLEEHRSIKKLCVHGSFASHPFCTQLLADICNKPVFHRKNSDSVAYGAFLLSATEMGIYPNLSAAAQSVVIPEQYHPTKTLHASYMKYFKIFERLSTKLADEFEEISNLQQT
jgi:gluconokinase